MPKPIIKSQLHSVRLDSDVWAAVKAMPESLNRYLRHNLLLESPPASVGRKPAALRDAISDAVTRQPLLKPSEKRKRPAS